MNSNNNKFNLLIATLLTKSVINYPIHYNPEKKTKSIDHKILLMGNYSNKSNKTKNSISEYAKNKSKNKICLLKRLQRNKIDIFINKAFDKNNNNIRDYNYKNSNKKIMELKEISNLNRELIKDNILVKYNNFLGNKHYYTKSPIKDNKQYIWSNKFLQEKQLKDYRRIYSLKYLKVDESYNFKKIKNSLKIVKNIIGDKSKKNKTFTRYYFSPKK